MTEKIKLLDPKIDNPIILGQTSTDKISILDIKGTTNIGEIINIEIQLKNEYNIIERCVYYGSKLISSQLVQGTNYNTLKKSIVICILNYSIFTDEVAIHNRFLLKNSKSEKVLTNLLELHYLELSKLINIDEHKNKPWYPWMLFLTNQNSEVLQMAKRSIPELEKALALLEELSTDKELQNIYEQKLKADLDRNSALEQATRSGSEQERRRNVLGLYKAGIPIDTISKAINLSIEELSLIIS